MELLKYDKRTETSTITLTDVELVELNELVLGVLNTYGHQDPTIIGVSEERLEQISKALIQLLQVRVAPQPAIR